MPRQFHWACRTVSRFLYPEEAAEKGPKTICSRARLRIATTEGAGCPAASFSSPRRAAVIPLGKALLPSSSNLPGSRTERAAPPPLFGLAPHGVCPAGRIAPSAVRSYRTFSPLPKIELAPNPRRYIFCGTFREIRFERTPPAVSRHAALWRPDFPPAKQVNSPGERPPVRQARLNSRRNLGDGSERISPNDPSKTFR